MVARFLRTDVRIVLVGHLVAIDTDKLTGVAVAVVLDRTTAIIRQLIILVGHLKLHAVTEHRRHPHNISSLLRRIGQEVLVDDHLAIGLKRIGHGECSGDIGHIKHSHNAIVEYLAVFQLHLRILPYTEALLQTGTIVVVRRRTPELGGNGLTVDEHRMAINIKVVNPPAPLTHSQRGTSNVELDVALGLLLLHISSLGLDFGELIGIKHKLLTSHHLTFLNKRLSLAGLELEDDEDLLIAVMTQHTLNDLLHGLDGDNLTLLRGNTIDGDGATVTKGHTFRTVAVVMMGGGGSTDKPLELEVVEGLEEVLVVDLDLTFLQALVGNPHVLIVVAHLVGMGIQTAVRSDDTITVEVVVGSRIAAIVATISKDLLASDLALITQTLIDKVPDIATLIFRILTDDVPVLLETTHRVTHRMGVLALDQRTGIVALGVFLAVLIAIVHRTEDIGLALTASLLILHRARGVVGLHPVVAFLEVRTIAGLVA